MKGLFKGIGEGFGDLFGGIGKGISSVGSGIGVAGKGIGASGIGFGQGLGRIGQGIGMRFARGPFGAGQFGGRFQNMQRPFSGPGGQPYDMAHMPSLPDVMEKRMQFGLLNKFLG